MCENTTLSVEKQAAELLRCAIPIIKKGWVKGVFQMRNVVREDGSKGDAYCAIGALRYCNPNHTDYVPTSNYHNITAPGGLAVHTLCGVAGVTHIPDWNDAPERKKEDVLKALADAAEKLYPTPVSVVEPEPVTETLVEAAPETTIHNPRILKRRDLKPGDVFVYLAWPSFYTANGHDINAIRYVKGAQPSYLFRSTRAHKARFSEAQVSNPFAGDEIQDSPVLLFQAAK